MNPDIRDVAATLIGHVGRVAEDARRYRALAAMVADPTFERLLEIGSTIRRANRAGQSTPITDAVAEMRELLRRCEEGIHNVRASSRYHELVAAFGTGPVARATELAAAIFTGVTMEVATQELFWTVPITTRQYPEHFIPPDQSAGKIREVASAGLSAPTYTPDSGGDTLIRPLRLASSVDACDGPITLVYTPAGLPGPIGKLGQDEIVLWYAESLRAPFIVRAAPAVSDEWWEVRPAAYAAYLERLASELETTGVPFQITDTPFE